jgi:type I restriction enzyme R subunit
VLPNPLDDGPHLAAPRKFYVDGNFVEIVAHLVYDLDAEGRRFEVRKLTEYAAESVRQMYGSASELRARWSVAAERAELIASLQERGVLLSELVDAAQQPETDPLDLLCNLAFDSPLRTRKERADALRARTTFFSQYGVEATIVLQQIVDKYCSFGVAEFDMPDNFKVPPLSEHGNVNEIAKLFGALKS